MSRLQDKYRSEVVPALKQELSEDNVNAIPRLDKIVVSMGLGRAVQESSSKVRDNKRFHEALEHLSTITGQRPLVTKARKSVSNFKVREDWDVGLKVTLRGQRMYEKRHHRDDELRRVPETRIHQTADTRAEVAGEMLG